MKIYGDKHSGNCYKLVLAGNLLGFHYEWVDVDILNGETQTPEFLAKSPNGKIPLLELENGLTLSESNAILNYLCDGSSYYPADIWIRAKIHQWQFFEQYSHEPYIAVARFINKYLGLPEERKEEYASKQVSGNKALSIMNTQLEHSPFLVTDYPTTADISLFAYTHVANEGGFDLRQFPAVRKWVERILGMHSVTPMQSPELEF